MARVFLLCGKAATGKDTAADILMRHYPGALRTSFAKKLKTGAADVFGLDPARMLADGAYKAEHRDLLIWFGQMCRARDPDVWVRHVAREIMGLWADTGPRPSPPVVVTDCRFPNEVSYLQQAGYEVVPVRILAFRGIRAERMGAAHWETYRRQFEGDISETAMDDWYSYRALVANNGTLEELEAALATANLLP